MRRDASKSTCYRCGNVGHFASDPKCPQYKKPEQRCIFTAQIIDDMSDIDQPDHANAPENPDKAAEPEVKEDILDEGQEELSNPESCPDGSQYEDKEPSYKEYDGYALPSDNDKPVYIRAMHEDEAGATLAPPQFDDVDR
jgi:Zinc knuckle